MRIAYLDCFSGISGDMFLGALVDAGVSPQLLEETVAALGVGAKLEISRVMRSGISATKVDVWVDGEKDMPREEYWAKQDRAQRDRVAQAHHEHEHATTSTSIITNTSMYPTMRDSRAGVPAPHEHCARASWADRNSRNHLARLRSLSRRRPPRFAFLRRWARRRRRFTTCRSKRFTFTKSARWMRWSILSARRSARRRWAWTRSSARR